MVEIDTPGHTAVIAQAHPDFVACAEATPWASFANGAQRLQAHVGLCISSRLLSFLIAEPPAGQLRFVNATVTSYIADLFVAAAKMFPSTLFSTGGDELNTNCYAADTPTQAALNASGSTLEEALNVFTQKTHQALEAKGKTPVVWEGAFPPGLLLGLHAQLMYRDGPRSQRNSLQGHAGVVSTLTIFVPRPTLTMLRTVGCGFPRTTSRLLRRRAISSSTLRPTTSIW